jgi:hypothetical protein
METSKMGKFDKKYDDYGILIFSVGVSFSFSAFYIYVF